MSADITTIITACISSGIFVKILDMLQERFHKSTADKKMLLGIGHDILFARLEEYMKRGYITLDELENLSYLYVPYKELGGNGTCEALYDQVVMLPHSHEEMEREKHESNRDL